MPNTGADHAVITKAGKATAVLQFFAVGLVVVLGFIYFDISARYTAMQSGVRENAMWSVYQLDREARNLTSDLTAMLATDDLDHAAQKKLSIRYDILYSRMDMLAKAKFEKYFVVDDVVAKQLSAIQRSVFGNVHIFDDIEKGVPASRPSLIIANASFKELIRNSEDLVNYTNNTLSNDRADQRTEVAALETKSLILISLLGVIVGALILTLRRQLTSVRAAGLSFERMAVDLESAYRGAEAGNRVKSQFMATMSHEIRTPLNAILGTVELMGLSPTDPEVTRNLHTIQKSGEALLDIINEILDYSKIEHGRLELETRDVDIRACAENAAEMIRGRAVETGNIVLLDMPAELELPYVRTDATRLRQVMLNLMSNAVKFTMNGTVTLAVRELTSAGKQSLRVEVRDTGIGIDEAGRAKLFLPFSQVDASIARKYGGTGLGLTICKEIVERLGGTIGVESAIGSGSTFWFEIPVERGVAPVQTKAISRHDAVPVPRLRVLVVEDNVVNLHVATKFLDHLGQEIHSAENGAVAVAKAARTRFDLILMDMQMPVMDGIEATTLIRAGAGKSRNAPIVAMTANASDDDTRKCIDAGMDGFQSKPVSIEKLRRVIIGAAASKAAVELDDNDETEITKQDTKVVDETSPLDLASFNSRRAELIEVLGEEDFSELLDAFFADAASILNDLRDVMASDDGSKIERLLHTMKGAAANVGLQSIATVAQEMRQQAFGESQLNKLVAVVGSSKAGLAA